MALLVDDFLEGAFAQTARRFHKIRQNVRDVKVKTALGKGYETDGRNVAEHAEVIRNAPLDDFDPNEAMIGETGDILSTETLETGILVRRMVVQIVKQNGKDATGFFIGNSLLMTNAHVIKAEADAIGPQVVCGNQATFYDPNPIFFDHFRMAPDRFFWTDENLDITVVAVKDPRLHIPETDPEVNDFGYMPLIKQQGKAIHGDPLNIFHYPGAQRQRVTLHNGNLAYLDDGSELDPFFWHTCDTQRGSSGAPVLNRHWQVVGVHSKGVPDINKKGELLDRDGKTIAEARLSQKPFIVNWVANQGTRASRIVTALEQAELNEAMSTIRDDLLALWSQPDSWLRGIERTIQATDKIIRE